MSISINRTRGGDDRMYTVITLAWGRYRNGLKRFNFHWRWR